MNFNSEGNFSLDNLVYSSCLSDIREKWEETSHLIELEQVNSKYVNEEREYRKNFNTLLKFYVKNNLQWEKDIVLYKTKFIVCYYLLLFFISLWLCGQS